VLAQRAASEGPRWTRAVGDQAGHVPYVPRADERPLSLRMKDLV